MRLPLVVLQVSLSGSAQHCAVRMGLVAGVFSGWRYDTLVGTRVKRKNVRLYNPCPIPYTESHCPHTTQSQSLSRLHHDTDTNPQQSHTRESYL